MTDIDHTTMGWQTSRTYLHPGMLQNHLIIILKYPLLSIRLLLQNLIVMVDLFHANLYHAPNTYTELFIQYL